MQEVVGDLFEGKGRGAGSWHRARLHPHAPVCRRMGQMLKVNQLRKSYRGVEAVKDVSFLVKGGETYGLLGPNGSGKSTTLHSIVGIVQPTSGSLEVCGYPADTVRAKEQLGFVPDDLSMPEALTGQEFLAFLQRLYGAENEGRTQALVEIFGLRDALGRLIEEYSHGMKKKLQIAAALAHSPQVVILDEPFRGLDPEAAINLRHLLVNEKARGSAILIATHDLLMAQQDCDSIGIISEGNMVVQGPVEALLRNFETDSLEDVFLRASGLLDRRKDLEKYFEHL